MAEDVAIAGGEPARNEIGAVEVTVDRKSVRRTWTALVGAVALLATLVPVASAAPAAPEIVVTSKTDQVGVWSPSTGQYAAGWADIVINNNGTSAYTQLRLKLTSSDPSLLAVAALDATKGVPTTSSLCSIVANEFQCAWPNSLGGGASTLPLRFVFGGTVVPAEIGVTATVTSKDLTNTGGSNQDREDVYPDVFTLKTSDRAEERTNFTPPNTSISLSTFRGAGQKSAISLPSSTTGYLVDLEELAPGTGSCTVPTGKTGVGNEVSASVNNGAPVKPYMSWTITIIKATNTGGVTGVVHCLDNGTQVVISASCSKQVTVDCIESLKVTYSGKDKTNATYVIKFRTPGNGSAKSYG